MNTMIINQQNKADYTDDLEHVIIKTANACAKLGNLTETTELSVLIIDDNYIKELNTIYRGVNKPTDVLSFSMNELTEGEPDFDFPGDVNFIGDIVISLERAKKQSEEYGHSLARELGYLVAHGILHLLGYDHETDDEKTIMRTLEEKIMQDIKLTR